MNIKKNDLILIGGALVVGVAVVAYVLCNSSLAQKTETFRNTNNALQTEVDYLQDLMNHKDEYIADTESMTSEIQQIISEFPADVKPENQIMYVNDIELRNDMVVTSLEMPDKELVALSGGEAVQPAADATAETGDAEITEEPAEGATVAAEPVAQQASGEVSSILLYRNETTFQFNTTYKSAKNVLKSVCEDISNKKSIEALTLAIDETTRNLTGNMSVAMYSLGGIDKKYEPPVVNGVRQGTDNIFKSIDNAALLKSSTTEGTVDAEAGTTEDENKEDADKADDKEE